MFKSPLLVSLLLSLSLLPSISNSGMASISSLNKYLTSTQPLCGNTSKDARIIMNLRQSGLSFNEINKLPSTNLQRVMVSDAYSNYKIVPENRKLMTTHLFGKKYFDLCKDRKI